MSTTANPNGHIGIVFTYGGTDIAGYDKFLGSFYLTLPGGGGVYLGSDQFHAGSKAITLGSSHAMSDAKAVITDFLTTDTGDSMQTNNLTQAFNNWATAKGISEFAGLNLSNFTGGRVYISNCDLQLGATGEPGTRSDQLLEHLGLQPQRPDQRLRLCLHRSIRIGNSHGL